MKRHAGTHTRAGWIGARDGLEADELRPGNVLVRARVRLSGWRGRRTSTMLFGRDGFRKLGLKPIFVKQLCSFCLLVSLALATPAYL